MANASSSLALIRLLHSLLFELFTHSRWLDRSIGFEKRRTGEDIAQLHERYLVWHSKTAAGHCCQSIRNNAL